MCRMRSGDGLGWEWRCMGGWRRMADAACASPTLLLLLLLFSYPYERSRGRLAGFVFVVSD